MKDLVFSTTATIRFFSWKFPVGRIQTCRKVLKKRRQHERKNHLSHTWNRTEGKRFQSSSAQRNTQGSWSYSCLTLCKTMMIIIHGSSTELVLEIKAGACFYYVYGEKHWTILLAESHSWLKNNHIEIKPSILLQLSTKVQWKTVG